MECNISGLKNKISSLDQAVATIHTALGQGEWDDIVKESYVQYGKDCQSIAECIKQMIEGIDGACNSISSIDEQSMCNEVNSLNLSVQNIRVGE